jgi:hypothetical protein
MFCPQCGQQQVTGAIRFCSRCGFPLDGVIQLLGNGGMLPVYRSPEEASQISPRRRGVKQGGLLFLLGALIVPILGVMASFAPHSAFLQILLAFAAIICFVGGPLRMLYAAIFEEGAPNRMTPRPYMAAPMSTPQFGPPRQNVSLPPPPPSQSPAGWRRRPITAELANSPSVTENTTRLLDKEEHTDR